jgi:hypothetical protein
MWVKMDMMTQETIRLRQAFAVNLPRPGAAVTEMEEA